MSVRVHCRVAASSAKATRPPKSKGECMAIVARIDFGTLSVRLTLVDSQRGRLGYSLGRMPLVRKREDPDDATQLKTVNRCTLTQPSQVPLQLFHTLL